MKMDLTTTALLFPRILGASLGAASYGQSGTTEILHHHQQHEQHPESAAYDAQNMYVSNIRIYCPAFDGGVHRARVSPNVAQGVLCVGDFDGQDPHDLVQPDSGRVHRAFTWRPGLFTS